MKKRITKKKTSTKRGPTAATLAKRKALAQEQAYAAIRDRYDVAAKAGGYDTLDSLICNDLADTTAEQDEIESALSNFTEEERTVVLVEVVREKLSNAEWALDILRADKAKRRTKAKRRKAAR